MLKCMHKQIVAVFVATMRMCMYFSFLIFFKLLEKKKSIVYPQITAMKNLMIKSFVMIFGCCDVPSNTSIASSDVERNTERSVPGEMSEAVKRFAASTGIPHSGIQPSNAPRIGPALRKRISIS